MHSSKSASRIGPSFQSSLSEEETIRNVRPDVSYPYSTVSLNNREIAIQTIVDGSAIGNSEFENSTLDFIRDWLSGVEKFHVTTSGSTGAPKPLQFRRSQMIASALATKEALSLTRGMSALVCIDTRYIGGKMMLVRSLEIGMRIIAVQPDPLPLEQIAPNVCVNFAAFVPYQIYSALDAGKLESFRQVDKAIIGGAPLSEEAVKRLDAAKTEFYLTYGMTETLSHIALRKLNGQAASRLYKTLPGILAALDERGCLIIKAGYIDEEVITNDIVRFHAHDRFEFIGRFDNVINSGGIKIQPERLEEKLSSIFENTSFANRFFIAGIPHSKLGESVALVVEFSDTSPEPLEKKIPELIMELPSYERPRHLFILPKLVLTQSGKINRVKSLADARGPIPLEKIQTF